MLVGNGFDLNLGLDTEPRSFLSAFVKKHSPTAEGSEALSNNAPNGPALRLAERISKDGISAWSAYEEKMGECSLAFSKGETVEYLEEIDALFDYLVYWLTEEDKRLDEHFIDRNAETCLKSLATLERSLPALQRNKVNKIYSAHKTENRIVDLLCFNYTRSLELMYEKLGGENATLFSLGMSYGNHSVRLGKFIHVHDSLQGVPVTGVNDVGQIANRDFANNTTVERVLVKGTIQREVLHKNDDYLGFDAISRAQLIVVFGMSYGACDRRWWEKILERMETDKEVILIQFNYFPKETDMTPLGLLRREQQAINDLMRGAGVDSLDEDISSRIILADSRNLFPITEEVSPKESGDDAVQV